MHFVCFCHILLEINNNIKLEIEEKRLTYCKEFRVTLPKFISSVACYIKSCFHACKGKQLVFKKRVSDCLD